MAHDLTIDESGNIVISTGYTLGQFAAGIHMESAATNISGAVGTLAFGGKAVLLHTVTGDLSGSYTFPPTGLPALTQNSTRSVLYIEYTQDGTGGWAIPLATLFANATSVWGNPSVDTAVGGKTRVKIIVKRIGGVLTYHVEFQSVHVHSNLYVYTEDSITGGGDLSTSRTLALVNDTTSPGNHKYYKTDASGVRGWQSVNIQDIENITVTAPAVDQVLTYNGSIWVNSAQIGGGGGVASEVVESQAALTSIATPTDGQLVNVRGHTAKGDGGGGVYIWVASETDNQMLTNATVAAGGTGYAVGDLLYVVGGTSGAIYQAIVRVATLSGSAVATVTIVEDGKYSVAAGTSAIATTSATGTGCTLNLTWASHSDFGTTLPTNAGGAGRWLLVRDSSGRVPVKCFGAKGDGSTNDWVAIMRAISSEAPLYFASGTYNVGSAITWNKDRKLNIKGANKTGFGSSTINFTKNTDEPLLHKFGRYMDKDGLYVFESGFVGNTNATGEPIVLEDIELKSSASIYGHCCEVVLTRAASFTNVSFFAAFRGLTFGTSCFDSTTVNCSFDSTFMNNFPWAGTTGGESNKVIARRAWGLLMGSHVFSYGSKVVGNGCGVYMYGAGNVFSGARMEVNNYGIICAATGYYDDGIKTVLLSRSSIDGVSMEANTVAIRIENWSGCSLTNFGIQGSPSAGVRPVGEVAIEMIGSSNSTTIISNGFASGDFVRGAIINNSRSNIHNVTASATGGGVSYARANSVFGQTGSSVPNYRLIQYRTEAGVLSSFTDMMHPSLTGLNLRDGLIKSKNFGDVATPATGASTVAVVFPVTRSHSTFAFNAITTPTNGSSTLSTGTYYYATTVLGKSAEVGINYNDATIHAHRTVAVTAGQAVAMTFFGGTISSLKRRIYRTRVNSEIGNFEGYWQQDSTSASFTDIGQTFTGRAQPPILGDITSCAEDDTNYQIVATPSWGTTVWVTAKTTTGFTLNFGTVAPAGGTCAWLMFRP